jgi:cytochrome c-type biogenesis protein CcmH/NrfF
MGAAIYVLIGSGLPMAAKIIFCVLPLLVWILGGIAIIREHREQKRDRQKEDELLEEAKRILDEKDQRKEKQE